VRMTTKKHLKRRARTRATVTGEPYATALRSVRRQQESRMPSTSSPIETAIAHCSFCGKPNTEVQRLVAGPGVFICNECVALCATIIEGAASDSTEEVSARRAAYRERSNEEILAALPALVRAADRVEGELAALVSRLRERGAAWDAIAGATGSSVDAVRDRFHSRVPGG
jgi:hypothetical protein